MMPLRRELDGDWLRLSVADALRRSDGTIEDAALQMGVHRSTLSRWLNGRGRMSDDKLAKLIDYLGKRTTIEAALY